MFYTPLIICLYRQLLYNKLANCNMVNYKIILWFSKLLITIIILSLILLVYLTTSYGEIINIINDNLYQIRSYGEKNFIMLNIIFFSIYLIVATLSLPFALLLGLLSGMIFDPINAILLVSFASTIGATFAFLLSRYLFADIIKLKFSSEYEKIDKGFQKYNNYYRCFKNVYSFSFFYYQYYLRSNFSKILNFYLMPNWDVTSNDFNC